MKIIPRVSKLLTFFINFVFPFIFEQSYGQTIADLCNIIGSENFDFRDNGLDCTSFDAVCDSDFEIPGIKCTDDESLNYITEIDFSGLGLTGYLPSTISSLSNLEKLDLSGNNFEGSIPETWGNLVQISSIRLDSNSIVGVIPSSLCHLSNLSELKLSSNNFQCYDPCVSSMGSLKTNDFLHIIPQCTTLAEREYFSKNIRTAFQTCEHPHHDKNYSSFQWSNLDFCSFYSSTSCTSGIISSNQSFSCSPECVRPTSSSVTPMQYCLSFALLSLGCGTDEGKSYADVNSLVLQCLSSQEATDDDSLTSNTYTLEFNITNIDSALLSVDLQDASQLSKHKSYLKRAIASSAALPIPFVTVSDIDIYPNTSTARITAAIEFYAPDYKNNIITTESMAVETMYHQLVSAIVGDPRSLSSDAFLLEESEFVHQLKTYYKVSTQDSTASVLSHSSFVTALTTTSASITLLYPQQLGDTDSAFASTVQFTATADTVSQTGTGSQKQQTQTLSQTVSTAAPSRVPSKAVSAAPLAVASYQETEALVDALKSSLEAAATGATIAAKDGPRPTAPPVSRPTPKPSPLPSEVPTSDNPTPAPVYMQRCLDLQLVDLFGDGWDTAKLSVSTSYGRSTQTLAPTCEKNPLYARHCFNNADNTDGDYVVFMIVGFSPAQPWEIYWRVTDDYTGDRYIGDSTTTLIFTFKEKFKETVNGRFVLQSYVELTNSVGNVITKLKSDTGGAVDTCESCVVYSYLDWSTVDGSLAKSDATHDQDHDEPDNRSPAETNGKAGKKDLKNNKDINAAENTVDNPRRQPKAEQPKSQAAQPAKPQEQPKTQAAQPAKPQEQPKTQAVQPVKLQEQPKTQAAKPQEQPKTQAVQQAKPQEQPKTQAVQPAKPQEQPKTQAVQPAKPQEQPKTQAVQPAKPQEQPKIQAVQPAKPQEQPKIQAVQPAKPQEQPKTQAVQPAKPQEQPKTQAVQPAKPQEQPKTQEVQPAKIGRVGRGADLPGNPHRQLQYSLLPGSSSLDFDLTYSLSGYQDTWYSSNGFSARLYVFSDSDELYFSGTLCASSDTNAAASSALKSKSWKDSKKISSNINRCLGAKYPDGEYRFRVTGGLSEHSEDVLWSFCGMTGKAQTELIFKVTDNRCSPVKLQSVSYYCSSAVAAGSKSKFQSHHPTSLTATTVEGLVELEMSTTNSSSSVGDEAILTDGAEEEALSLSPASLQLVRDAILLEFSDADLLVGDDSEDSQVAVTELGVSTTVTSRRLTSTASRDITSGSPSSSAIAMKQISFRIRINLPDVEASDAVKAYLDKSMANGLFVTRIRSLCRQESQRGSTQGMALLKSLRRASLLDLKIIHEVRENIEVSTLSTLVVLLSGLSGLVFATLFVVAFRRRHQQRGPSPRHRYQYVLAMPAVGETVDVDFLRASSYSAYKI